MKRRKRASGQSSLPALLILGTGLILLGLAAIVAWPKPGASSEAETLAGSATIPVAVHYAAPELKLSGLDGVEYSLTDFRGQVILVNLWATWCPPCKAEMPTLETFYKLHQEDGFVTVAINDGDPTEDVSSFVKEYNLSFKVLLDPTYQATDHAFKTRNLPSSFVIDRDGNVRLRWVGEIDQASLEKYVTPLILE